MNFLLLLLVIVSGGFVIFKVAMRIIKRIDVIEKIENRNQRKGIYKKYLKPITSEDSKKDKEIKEKLDKFINKDF